MLRSIALSLCLFFCALPMSQAGSKSTLKPTPVGKKTGLIDRSILFGNPSRASAKISPDGTHLSYLAPVKGVMNVWVAPVDDLNAAKPVTEDKKRGIRSYFWAYDNKHILYLQDKGGDENWHVYSVDLETNKTTNLTPLKKVRANIEAVSHKFPEEILVGLNDRVAQFHDLYRININTGEKKLVQKNQGYLGFTTDDDYNVRFASKFDKDGSTVFLKPGKGDKWEEFLRVPMTDNLTTNIVGFDKTGKVAYLIDSRKRNTAALTKLDLSTGKQTVIAANKLADISGAMLHPTENTVEAVTFTYARSERKILDPGVKKKFQQLKKIAKGDITVTSRTLDDSKWVVAFLRDTGATKYYLFDGKSGKVRYLFSNRDDLDDLPLQPMHPVIVKSRDKLNLVCYLTLPPGSGKGKNARPKQPVPMVLLVHGGPWARDNWGYNPLHQFLANRGYAVLSVNYRGSTGFGKNFLNAGNKEWAGKMHNDLIDAVDWAVKEKIAIKDKIAIMGGSYGGYATLVGLTFTPKTFACGVDIVGPSNIVTLLNTIPPYWAPAVQLFKDRVGDHTSEAGKLDLENRSPLNFVDKICRPLLIGQGANDPRVKQSESDQIVKAMKKKNIPVSYVLFPDEGHGFARPANKLAFFAITEAFLAGQIGGRYQAIGDAFDGASVTVPDGASDVPGLVNALKARKSEKK